MGSEMKSIMRKPGEESLVGKPVDNPTGYGPFLSTKKESTSGTVLVGGDIIQDDDLLSKEKKKGGRSTPYSDPSKNVVDMSVARTSSPLEKENKAVPLSTGPGVSQTLSDNKTAVESFPPTTDPSYERDLKAVEVNSKNTTMMSSSKHQSQGENTSSSLENRVLRKTPSKDQTAENKAVEVNSKDKAMISSSETQPQGENLMFDNRILRKNPSKDRTTENKGILSNGTASQYSDGTPERKATREEVPSTVATEKKGGLPLVPQATEYVSSTTPYGKKDDGRGTQYSNQANATRDVVADQHYVANKNIAVPLATTKTKADPEENTKKNTDQKGRKGSPSPCCSIL